MTKLLNITLILLILLSIFLSIFYYINHVDFIKVQDYIQNNKLPVEKFKLDFTKEKFVEFQKRLEYVKKIDKYYNNLSEDQKIGQLLWVGVDDTVYNSYDQKLLDEIGPFGIVYMKYNINTQTSTKTLSDALQKNTKIPLFISTDEEGGSVTRLTWLDRYGDTQYIIARNYSNLIPYGVGLSHSIGLLQGGLNTNFAPVADIGYNNNFILNRTYGTDPEKVSRIVGEIARGQSEKGIFSVFKHFPGIGAANNDPHKGTSTVSISKTELYEDMKSFSDNLKYADFIMTSHIMYKNLDDGVPATYSKKIVDILKNEFNYQGLVITDEVEEMDAVSQDDTKYVKALSSGHDVILTLAKLDKLKQTIVKIRAGIPPEELEYRIKKNIDYKLRKGLIK